MDKDSLDFQKNKLVDSKKYLLIKDKKVIGKFNSFFEAYSKGLETFQDNEFIVSKSEE